MTLAIALILAGCVLTTVGVGFAIHTGRKLAEMRLMMEGLPRDWSGIDSDLLLAPGTVEALRYSAVVATVGHHPDRPGVVSARLFESENTSYREPLDAADVADSLRMLADRIEVRGGVL